MVRADGALGVGEVGLACFSHARCPTERVPQNPFSDGFKRKSNFGEPCSRNTSVNSAAGIEPSTTKDYFRL